MVHQKAKNLSEFIELIYQAPLEPDGWNHFLSELTEFHSSSGGIIAQSTNSGAGISLTIGVEQAAILSYEKYYSERKPWLPKLQKFRPLEVFSLENLTTERDYRRSEYFNNWIRPQDKYYLIGGLIECRGAISMILTLMRSERLGDFSLKEREFYGLLLPHLRQSLQIHHHLAAVDRAQHGLLGAFDGLTLGVVLCDAEATIIFANTTAEAIFHQDEGLWVKQGQLCASRPADTTALRSLIWHSSQTGVGRSSGGMMTLPRPSTPPLSVLVSPLPFSSVPELGGRTASALVFISDPATAPGLGYSVHHLCQLYGLTRAEGTLLNALVGGATLQTYADEAAITLNTAKTHLRHIFEKTGHNRQTDVIRSVLTNPILRLATG